MSKARIKLNATIESLIAKKKANSEAYTLEDINLIQQYTGKGGIGGGSTDRGILYEYYTPMKLVERMWALAYHHGFKSGHILEPSCGTGRFLKFIDFSTSSCEAFEMSVDDTVGFDIAKASYPKARISNDYFESIFYEGNKRLKKVEPRFDLIIGNPPYGKLAGYYQGKGREAGKTQARTYDQYFIEKGIELLKPEGLLVFVVPSSFLDNAASDIALKIKLSHESKLIDAYRLPANIFLHTTIQTDIIVIKKKGFTNEK